MVRVTDLERQYYSRKITGATPQMSLAQIKRTYFVSQIGGTVPSSKNVDELELEWLAKLVGAADSTPYSLQDLWRRAVISLTQTPSQYLKENKIRYFLNAA